MAAGTPLPGDRFLTGQDQTEETIHVQDIHHHDDRGPRDERGAALAQSQGDYCAQGFLSADANADDMISMDEATAAGDAIFAAMDRNGDGMVSQTEYKDCRGAWMANVSTPGAGSADDLAALGGDDGAMTGDEYAAAAMEALEGAGQPSGAQSTAADARSGDAEAATQEESAPVVLFRRMIVMPAESDRSPADMTREEVANRASQRFMMMDRNRDDRIDAEEWAQQETLNDDLEDIINMQFEEADADASGGLTREEMRAAARRRGEGAMARASEAGEGSDVGAPVIYFVFPHPL
jgi:Ca2+-binding EF-hand superfamily protein